MHPIDLFDDLPPPPDAVHSAIAPGAILLRGFAREGDAALFHAVEAVICQAPLRHMQTPGGYTMSVATTSCGRLGWVSDSHGYRYSGLDPHSGQPWPTMPCSFLELAQSAAAQAGYADFVPDACLINLTFRLAG